MSQSSALKVLIGPINTSSELKAAVKLGILSLRGFLQIFTMWLLQLQLVIYQPNSAVVSGIF